MSQTSPENVKKDSVVDTMMIWAMRPESAPNRSATIDVFVALGNAATSMTAESVLASMRTPICSSQ